MANLMEQTTQEAADVISRELGLTDRAVLKITPPEHLRGRACFKFKVKRTDVHGSAFYYRGEWTLVWVVDDRDGNNVLVMEMVA